MPFLTLLDDQARPKGSRDPLGFELVWSYFGRKIIGNLTTITSSMDNFAVALLGFYWANLHVPASQDKALRHKSIREYFLRYEQLAGYIRYYGGDEGVMGITRIKQRMRLTDPEITLGMRADQQILSNQASYGLWGLYSAATRESLLVKGDNRELTPKGQFIVDAILSQLSASETKLLQLIASNESLNIRQLKKLSDTFLQAICSERVRKTLLEALMTGKDPEGIQKELWLITQKIYSQSGDGQPTNFKEFIRSVMGQQISAELEARLSWIIKIERLLVAINNIFHYCRRNNGENLYRLIENLDKRYIYNHLPTSLPEEEFPRKSHLLKLLSAFQQNNTEQLIKDIIQLNKEVMQERSGAPWIVLEPDNSFFVRLPQETMQLKEQNDLEQDWDYDYFVDSYQKIASQHIGSA